MYTGPVRNLLIVDKNENFTTIEWSPPEGMHGRKDLEYTVYTTRTHTEDSLPIDCDTRKKTTELSFTFATCSVGNLSICVEYINDDETRPCINLEGKSKKV